MAKDDTLKKPKKIDVNRIMIFISSILIPFLWIDLYLVLKNASKMMVVGIIAALILVWTGLLVTYIHRMKNEEKAHSDEQVEELLRTGKANYLMQKKLAEKISPCRVPVFRYGRYCTYYKGRRTVSGMCMLQK